MDRTIHYFQDRTDIWIVRSTISRIGLIMDRTIHYFQDRTDMESRGCVVLAWFLMQPVPGILCHVQSQEIMLFLDVCSFWSHLDFMWLPCLYLALGGSYLASFDPIRLELAFLGFCQSQKSVTKEVPTGSADD